MHRYLNGIGAIAIAALIGLYANNASAAIVYNINFGGASNGAIGTGLGLDASGNLNNVNEAQFLASSFLGFNDNDHNGTISASDTFQDYTMLRITGFTKVGGGDITPLLYGSGEFATFELTIKAAFHGVQLTTPGVGGAGQYLITGVDLFNVNLDFGTGFTQSDFHNLVTFQDGPLAGAVETGSLGGLSGGTTNGPTAPDGTIDVVLKLFDQLHLFDPQGDYFELSNPGNNPLNTAGNFILQGIFDSNNLATPPGGILGGLNGGTVIGGEAVVAGGGFADTFTSFGLTGTQNADGTFNASSTSDTVNGVFEFAFQTRSDGSFVKGLQAVPEPTSLLVWGLVAGAGLVLRRRRV